MTEATPDEPVATGTRREEAHYEPKPGQLLKARFTEKPAAPLPPDEHTGRVDAGAPAEDGPPVEDVAVAPPSPSVWDARPTE
jgi:hypothetical protein